MAAEFEMKPVTTDNVGRHADELVSTGTRAAKAAPAPGQRGQSNQRSNGARVEAVDEPDAAEDEAGEVDCRAAVQTRRRRVTWIDGRAGARATTMIGHRMARGHRFGAMQVSRSEQGGDGRRTDGGWP